MELWGLFQIVESINVKPTNAKILQYLKRGWFLTQTKTQPLFGDAKRRAHPLLKHLSNSKE